MNRQLALLAALTLIAAAPSTNLPPQPAEPGAPPVTAENLLASEHFWPYRATLREPLARPDRKAPLPAGSVGVLIRVEEGGIARVDFGRDGLYRVPVASTDLVAGANRVRLGEEEKIAPHFVYALGPRVLDPITRSSPDLSKLSTRPGFLAVFADPFAKEFEAQVKPLVELSDRNGVATMFFPQGQYPDSDVAAKLIALRWPVLFVRDFLSEPYTRTLLDSGVTPPAVLLQTNEGRVLYESAWSGSSLPELEAKIDGLGTTARSD